MSSNYTTTGAGKKAAICQCCGMRARATEPNNEGEPDLWKMSRGWSEAPFPADHKHEDGSIGSRYTCPACNKLLRAGHTLQTRGGQRTRVVT